MKNVGQVVPRMPEKVEWALGQAAGNEVESCGEETLFRPARGFRGQTLTRQISRSSRKLK